MEIKEHLITNTNLICGAYELETIEMFLSAFANARPLPKGQGKLFDEKEINTVVNGVFNDYDKHSPKTFLDVIHNQCIEAVGADTAESEDEECTLKN